MAEESGKGLFGKKKGIGVAGDSGDYETTYFMSGMMPDVMMKTWLKQGAREKALTVKAAGRMRGKVLTVNAAGVETDKVGNENGS